MKLNTSKKKILLTLIAAFGIFAALWGFWPQPQVSENGWVKYDGNPVLGGDLGTVFDVSVLKEGDIFRMWFSWRPEASVALAESRDGIHWSEPVVVLKPSNESGWEERVNRPIVIHQADGYHMWYTGQTSWNSFIGHATSPDGVTWTRASQNPSLSPEQPWEKNAVMAPHVLWDAKKKVYKMWYSGGDQYEPDAIGYAESLDGQTWIRWPESVFTPSPKNQWDSYKVTGAQVMCNEGWYVMFYIGFRDMDHAQIGLARSRNGFSDWQRHPANPIIASGRLGAWDQDAIYKPFALLDNGHWYLWFNGRNGNVEQIGLATHAATDLGFGSDAIDDILSSNTSTCGQAND